MHQRKIEDNIRLNKLYNKTKYGYCCGVYKDKNGRLVRYYKSDSNCYRYNKRYARKYRRRMIKKINYDVSKHVFDLYWNTW